MNLHYRAGVRALLRLTVSDEEGPVALAPQHLLGLSPLDIADVPGALVVVRRALVLLQRVGAANKAHTVTSRRRRQSAELPKLQVAAMRQPVIAASA